MSHEAEAQYIYWIRYNEDEKAEIQVWKAYVGAIISFQLRNGVKYKES